MEYNAISQQRVHVNVCMCTELGAHTHVIIFLYLCFAHGSVKFRIFVHVCLWLHEYVYFMVFVCFICLCMRVCAYIFVYILHALICVCVFIHLCTYVYLDACIFAFSCA